ncbi:hypothetical protein, partial [Escherichia coli]|uniref:hypothetical protein n=1 Tax=Escherichia coli TaxID=562 RepID=UPI001BFC39FE
FSKRTPYRCFPPLRDASQVREMTQHIVSSADDPAPHVVMAGRWRCVGGEEDPEQPFFGSPIKKKEIEIC